MAKKEPDKKPDAPASAPAPAAPPPPPDLNFTDGDGQKGFPIKVWREGDVYETYLHDAPKDREVKIGGLPFDHVDTTPDGVWIYRNDRKN